MTNMMIGMIVVGGVIGFFVLVSLTVYVGTQAFYVSRDLYAKRQLRRIGRNRLPNHVKYYKET